MDAITMILVVLSFITLLWGAYEFLTTKMRGPFD